MYVMIEFIQKLQCRIPAVAGMTVGDVEVVDGRGKRGGLYLGFYLIACLAVFAMFSPYAVAAEAKTETAYDRVMRTGTLRCGYILYDPAIKMDLNTKKIYGILPDLLEDLTKRLSLKLEWTEEVPFVTAFEGLKLGRYDAVCTALWGWPEQARVGELVGPFYYYPIGIWVRADDHRFDTDRSKINAKDVKISGVDGTFPLDAARIDFPLAHAVSLPQSSDYTQPLMEVMTKKADITMMDNNIGLRFLKANPGTIRNISITPPYKIFGEFLVVPKGDHDLQSMLQSVVNLMVLDGSVDRTLKKYEAGAGAYYRVATPYQVP